MGVTAVLLARNDLRLWELILMAAIFGAADSFFGPASTAIMPELLADDQLVAGNALSQMSNQLTQGLLGPAVGGFIVAAIGTAWSFGLRRDQLSRLGDVLYSRAALGDPTRARHDVADQRRARRACATSGRARNLLYTVVGAALANFFGMAPLTVLLPLFVRQTLHGTAFDLGLVYGAGGATGVLASLYVARLGSPRSSNHSAVECVRGEWERSSPSRPSRRMYW